MDRKEEYLPQISPHQRRQGTALVESVVVVNLVKLEYQETHQEHHHNLCHQKGRIQEVYHHQRNG